MEIRLKSNEGHKLKLTARKNFTIYILLQFNGVENSAGGVVNSQLLWDYLEDTPEREAFIVSKGTTFTFTDNGGLKLQITGLFRGRVKGRSTFNKKTFRSALYTLITYLENL